MAESTHTKWPGEPPAWLYGLAVILCSAVLLTAWLNAASLVPIDETRYAGVAWEMLRSGNFLVPHSNGLPYPDKPPLLFWLLTAGWALFGPSIWWARLLPLLFALASLGMTLWLARCLWPGRPRTALLAPTILLGFALWATWSALVMFDVLLTFCVLLAITGVAIVGVRGRRRGWLLFALGIGLGILTKGPVAILHALPVALLAPLWLPRRVQRWRQWYGYMAMALLGGAVIALAWAIPAALAGGKAYGDAILWGQSAGRVAQSFAHARPWWWYFSVLPLVLAPWCYWATTWRALARLRPSEDASLRFILCWIAPVFIAFCLISGKQIDYLLPLLPAMALLLGRALDKTPGQTSTAGMLPVTLLLVILAAAIASAPTLREVFGWPGWSAHLPKAFAVVILFTGLLPLLPGHGKEQRVLTLMAASVMAMAALVWFGLPATAPRYDLRRASRIVAKAQRSGAPVAHVGSYDDQFQFLGRLSRPVSVIDGGEEALNWAKAHPRGLIIFDFRHGPRLQANSHAIYRQPFRGGWLAIVRSSWVIEHPGRFLQ